MSDGPITILQEEPSYLVIDKPSGVLMQAPPGVDSIQERLIQQLKQRDNHPGRPFIGLPHRLDRSTTGVALIARNQRALSRFGAQFQSRKVQKFYLGLFDGNVDAGKWQDHVRKVPDRPFVEAVSADEPAGKAAVLEIAPVASANGHTLAAIRLETGRMHQIRIQAALRGCPIIGDDLYAELSKCEGDYPYQMPAVDALALHALRIEFYHPKTAKLCSATAIPRNWQNWSPELAKVAEEFARRCAAHTEAWRLPE